MSSLSGCDKHKEEKELFTCATIPLINPTAADVNKVSDKLMAGVIAHNNFATEVCRKDSVFGCDAVKLIYVSKGDQYVASTRLMQGIVAHNDFFSQRCPSLLFKDAV